MVTAAQRLVHVGSLHMHCFLLQKGRMRNGNCCTKVCTRGLPTYALFLVVERKDEEW